VLVSDSARMQVEDMLLEESNNKKKLGKKLGTGTVPLVCIHVSLVLYTYSMAFFN
jgi:hypothetical protein